MCEHILNQFVKPHTRAMIVLVSNVDGHNVNVILLFIKISIKTITISISEKM